MLTHKSWDGIYENTNMSMGPGKYGLFNEYHVPHHKKNWVDIDTKLRNLDCPDTYYKDYN